MILPIVALILSAPAAQAAPATGEAARALDEESRQLGRIMLDSPDLLSVYRTAYEVGLAKELDHPSDGSKSNLEPDLRARLLHAAGDEYVAQLRAGLDRPIAAAGRSFAAHLHKYELDRLVEFLPTSGGRKFIAFIYRNALAISQGTLSQEAAGETLVKQLTLTEQQDLQATMEPGLLQGWKAASTEFRAAVAAWANAASANAAVKLKTIATQVTRDYLRAQEQPK